MRMQYMGRKRSSRSTIRKAKSSGGPLPQVEPVPLTIEEDLSQSDRLEPIKA